MIKLLTIAFGFAKIMLLNLAVMTAKRGNKIEKIIKLDLTGY